jgi:TetR/AcrR family transcriptional regulator, transcriptional repressor for nem operon
MEVKHIERVSFALLVEQPLEAVAQPAFGWTVESTTGRIVAMTSPSMTEQGRATRRRIVAAAAALIGERGVAGTSLDDVRAATNSSKSQLYHYFGDKHGLVQAVIDHQAGVVLGAQAEALDGVQDWRDLERWADSMVAMVERQDGRGGCPIGTLAAALADTDERFRAALSGAFESWREAIGGALARLQENRLLARDADLETLTTTTLAAIQGGLLLAKTNRDSSQLRAALDGAIAQLRAHAMPNKRQTPRR